MRRFRIALFVFTTLTHAPFAAAWAFALAALGAPAAGWLGALAGTLGVLPLRGRLRRLSADRPLSRWRRLLVEEPYFAHWTAAAVSLVPFVLGALVLLAHAAIAGASGLASRLGALAMTSYLTALVVASYGVFVRRRWLRVRALDVAVRDLPPAFERYRIAHVSDLHIGGLWPAESAARWVAAVRNLDVDLVALTGDYVTHGDRFHDDIAEILGAMRARDGAVAVLGNHDYFGDAGRLVDVIRARGVRVLQNERFTLARDGEAITIAGVDDTWSRRADVGRALDGASGPVVVLAHDPQLFPELARRGASVVLSGHTHWGQVAVPFLPTRYNLSRLSYRYHAGTYREGGAVLFVSPGLGTTGPPIRLGAPPEITVLRLKRAKDEDA